jgi:RNA-binding protein
MKIRVSAGDRDARDAIIADICARSGAELVQRIGNIALLFRPRRRDSRIVFPK